MHRVDAVQETQSHPGSQGVVWERPHHANPPCLVPQSIMLIVLLLVALVSEQEGENPKSRPFRKTAVLARGKLGFCAAVRGHQEGELHAHSIIPRTIHWSSFPSDPP